MNRILIFGLLLSFSIQAQEPEKPVKQEVLDACKLVVDSQRAKLEGLKAMKPLREKNLEFAMDASRDVMEGVRDKYLSEGSAEIRAIAKKYAATYRALKETEMPEGERSLLLASVERAVLASITPHFNSNKNILDVTSVLYKRMQPTMNQSYNRDAECTVKNGKVLACYQCHNLYRDSSQQDNCSLFFSIDLETGEILGLKDKKDQDEYLKSGFVSSSYSDGSEKQIETMEKGEGLPEVCRKMWEEELKKPYTPVATEATQSENPHGGDTQRPVTTQLNPVIRRMKVTLLTKDGLPLGSSDTEIGRKHLAEETAANPELSTLMVNSVALLQSVSKSMGNHKKQMFVGLPLHELDGACKDLNVSPVTALEVLTLVFPDLGDPKKLTLQAVQDKIRSETKTHTFDLELKMTEAQDSYYNNGGVTLALTGLDEKGEKTQTWSSPVTWTFNQHHETTRGIFSLAETARELALTTEYEFKPNITDMYSPLVVSDLYVTVLRATKPGAEEKIQQLIQERTKQCNDAKAAAEEKKAGDFEKKLSELFTELGKGPGEQ